MDRPTVEPALDRQELGPVGMASIGQEVDPLAVPKALIQCLDEASAVLGERRQRLRDVDARPAALRGQ